MCFICSCSQLKLSSPLTIGLICLFIYLKILSLQLPRNPYCSNEGTHCGCRLPTVTLQPPWVSFGVWGEVGSLYQSGGTLVKWDKQALPYRLSAGVSCPLTLHWPHVLWLLCPSPMLPVHKLLVTPGTHGPQQFFRASFYSLKTLPHTRANTFCILRSFRAQ